MEPSFESVIWVAMAQPEFMTRPEGDLASTSAGTRPVMEESTATMERSTLSSAKEEPSCSGAGASVGCAAFIGVLLRRVFPCLRDSTHSSSEYFSTRIQSIIESKSEFETASDAEIEASKVHWSEVPPGNGAEGCAEADMELFRRLQQQYASPDGEYSFFMDFPEDDFELGKMIAEGGQGAIHHLRWLRPEGATIGHLVVKVFKLEGGSLEALHQQWPPAMLHRIITSPDRIYGGEDFSDGISAVAKGVMLKDGRFGFIMRRCWGDLRKMIDLRMVHNGNQAPPFSEETALRIMHGIAKGMLRLHKDGILHRDLKAANVLIFPKIWIYGSYNEELDPIIDDEVEIMVADFECSAVINGTRFWRAPEILLGLKNRQVVPTLFTEKSDVYSYGMSCYEVLIGKIPLEGVPCNKYDEVIVHKKRPVLPSDTPVWIQSMLKRCWHHDPSQRPSFEEIVDKFELLFENCVENLTNKF
ncbi:hypothetical protein M758_11G037900 [Ceratodon purpureus]|nr:hypothetical protein M758_11G037900 [Ceratodon purpureus]